MTKLLHTMAFALVLIAFPLAGLADSTPTGEELAKKWNQTYYYAGKTAKTRVEMTITSASGQSRERRFMILRNDSKDLGDQQYFVYFQRPSDLRRMTLIIKKDADGEDDRWLYFPDLDLVKRIEGKQGRTSFAGSDFLYEDMSGRPIDADRHKLEKTSINHYVLLSIPKKPETVEFDAYRVYINKKTLMPDKAVFYRLGKKIRALEMLATASIDGYNVVTKARAVDYRTKSATTIELGKVQFDLSLPADLFEEGSLRSAPSIAKR